MTAPSGELQRLLAAIRACRNCVEAPQGKPSAARAAAGVEGERHGAACRVQPGARHQGAQIGHALHRPVGRTPARVDGDRERGILRRGAGRNRAHGVLLSRAGCERRRSAAAARMRAALASRAVRGAAADRTRAGGRAPTHNVGISATRRGGRCRRRCTTGGSISRANSVRASFRCRTPPGATMPGSRRMRGSSRSCCPFCGAK